MDTKKYRDNFPFGPYGGEKDAVAILQSEVDEETRIAKIYKSFGMKDEYCLSAARELIESANISTVLWRKILRKV